MSLLQTTQIDKYGTCLIHCMWCLINIIITNRYVIFLFSLVLLVCIYCFLWFAGIILFFFYYRESIQLDSHNIAIMHIHHISFAKHISVRTSDLFLYIITVCIIIIAYTTIIWQTGTTWSIYIEWLKILCFTFCSWAKCECRIESSHRRWTM